MASEAEVDLIISTADALPELERDLSRIIRTAEDGADTLDLEAALAVGESLANLAEDIERVVQSAESGASDIELEAALDTQRSLAHVQAQLESIVDRASRGEEIDLQAELDAVGSLQGIQNQLRTLVATAEATAPEIEIEAEVDRNGTAAKSTLRLGKLFGTLGKAVGAIPATMGAASLAVGGLASTLAATAVSLEAVAPAAAVAVTGLLAVQLVSGTVKLAMQGVGDAVKTAFDPDAKPEDLAKAMEKLAPNAKAFVTELRGMREGLRSIQQEVQQNFFAGFDKALNDLGKTTLPVVANALRVSSQTLNQMALGAATAASQLGSSGTLGRALSSANTGLLNLSKTPGQAVTALGQLAAAAGPSFERITAAAGAAATRIGERLSKAFESGALETAIDGAIDAVAQLGDIAGNVFGGLGNIIKTVSTESGGLFSILEKVTQAFEDVTASKGFQDALKALSETAGVVVDTVLPLLSQALQTLGPVFQALAAPVQILVRALGDGLGKVFAALEPVLVSVAKAFGQLVLLVTPFIDLASKLLVAILPALVPVFDGLGQAINAMLPFVEQLVKNIADQLLPVFTKLATEVLPQIIPPFVELSSKIFPVLTDLLVKLSPSLAQLGVAFGELLVAVTPLLVELANLTIQLVDELMPVIQPLIDLFIKLVNGGLALVVAHITGILVPALRVIVDLLKGDFSGAWEGAREIVTNVNNKIKEVVGAMVTRVGELFLDLGRAVNRAVTDLADRAARGFIDLRDRAEAAVRELPGKILGALGNTATLLVNAGADITRGLINGLLSQLGKLRDAASKIADTVSGSVMGLLRIGSPSKVMMEVGNDTMDGFLIGLSQRIPDLRSDLQGIAALAPSFALPNGQTLQLPQFTAGAPTVQVFIGNEQLNTHFDTRISRANENRDRTMTQGVRR